MNNKCTTIKLTVKKKFKGLLMNYAQDRPACIGRHPIKSSCGLPTVRAQSRYLQMQDTRNGAVRHDTCDSDYIGAETFVVSGDRGGRLHQLVILAAVVWGGESWNTGDCRGVCVLDGQRLPNLGFLQGTDVGAPHWLRQVT